jgi:hypothetical protein
MGAAIELKIPCVPMTPNHLAPLGPIYHLSDLGLVYFQHLPAEDDTSVTGEEFDANTPLKFYSHLGVPAWYEALSLFRANSSGGVDYLVTTTPATDKINWGEAATNDGVFANLADTNAQLRHWFSKVAQNQSATWSFDYSLHIQDYPASGGVLTSEDEWDDALINYLANFARVGDGCVPTELLPKLEDLPRRSMRAPRTSPVVDTDNDQPKDRNRKEQKKGPPGGGDRTGGGFSPEKYPLFGIVADGGKILPFIPGGSADLDYDSITGAWWP